jgi:hypothetical protein
LSLKGKVILDLNISPAGRIERGVNVALHEVRGKPVAAALCRQMAPIASLADAG